MSSLEQFVIEHLWLTHTVAAVIGGMVLHYAWDYVNGRVIAYQTRLEMRRRIDSAPDEHGGGL